MSLGVKIFTLNVILGMYLYHGPLKTVSGSYHHAMEIESCGLPRPNLIARVTLILNHNKESY